MRIRHGLLSAGVLGMAALAVTMAGPAGAATTPAKAAAHTAFAGGAGYTALAPIRVLDTRNGIGGPATQVGAGGVRQLNLSGEVPAGATAVVFNLTAVKPDANGPETYVTAWPDGQTRPGTSNLNLDKFPGTQANLVTVALPANRIVDLYNHVGSVNLIADLEGYYLPGDGAGYTTMAPARRVLDTRDNIGTTLGAFGPNTTRTLDLSGIVPAGTSAVTLNLTAVNATRATYITAWPAEESLPNVSNLNTFSQVSANLVTVAVSPDRKIDLYNHNGSTNLIADLAGFYVPGSGAGFTAVTPQRVLDTRNGTGGPQAPFGSGTVRALSLKSVAPAGSTSVIINLTDTHTNHESFVTAWPDGTQQPATSNLNPVLNGSVANLASVRLGSDDAIDLFNNVGPLDLVGDIAGYFGPAAR